jgi:hypothetical protein
LPSLAPPGRNFEGPEPHHIERRGDQDQFLHNLQLLGD